MSAQEEKCTDINGAFRVVLAQSGVRSRASLTGTVDPHQAPKLEVVMSSPCYPIETACHGAGIDMNPQEG
jgi:hypothetical protein